MKLAEEIQAHHFGASQNQITLHTGVLYIGSKEQVISFCTVSSCNRHDPSAIWAHLSPIMKSIKQTDPNIDTLHFFSDGPSTQYKQKNNFIYSVTEFLNMDLNREHGTSLNQDMVKGLQTESGEL